MKLSLSALAVLVLLAGCAAKQELSSSGTEDAPDTTVAKQDTDAGTPPNAGPATPGQPNEPPKTEGDPAKPTTTEAPAPGVTMASLAGKYDGKMTMTQESMDAILKMVQPAQQAEVKKGFDDLKSVKIDLELSGDGNYDVGTTMKGKTQHEKGKWSYDQAKGVITFKSPEMTAEQIAEAKKAGATDAMLEQARKKEQPITVSKDGRTLVLNNTEMGMNITVTFTKR